MKREPRVECPRCQGCGTVERMTSWGIDSPTTSVSCRRCDGFGKVVSLTPEEQKQVRLYKDADEARSRAAHILGLGEED